MPGTLSKYKGRRLEQEVVNIFKDHGIQAKRVSMMETNGEDKGDLEVEHKHKVEVKGGSQVPQFLYKARKVHTHILCMKRDREKWMVCMDLEMFIKEFLREGTQS